MKSQASQAKYPENPKLPGLIFQIASDGLRHPVALLNGDGRDAGEHPALIVFIAKRSEIAEHEYFPVCGQTQVGLDEHAAGAVEGST